MKFLCDQMCAKLARWLRTAGYNATIADAHLQDQDVFKQAVEEHRFLITRDRYFKEIDPEERTVIYLKGESQDEWAIQLTNRGVNWLSNPFSRCLECNNVLVKMDSSSSQVPSNVKETWFCSQCQKIYWMGSHTERMKDQLREWQKNNE